MSEHHETQAEERLKRANLRPTKHRIRVLTVLQEAERPLSHLEIQQLLTDIRLDRVTLYRILSSLADAELVHQVQGFDGTWRFCSHDEQSETCPGGHPHLLCESCGIMTCLPNQKLPHFDVPDDFQVTHKQMVISGICADCQKKNQSNHE